MITPGRQRRGLRRDDQTNSVHWTPMPRLFVFFQAEDGIRDYKVTGVQTCALPIWRLTWQLAELVEVVVETPGVKTLVFDVPGWPGHRAGQHVDVRLTAEDGYQAERSYSIASPPEEVPRVTLTVERLDDGEVSPYLVDELRTGDQLELRGPIGGYFVWEASMGGPLLLVAGGSGIVPLMAMLRHRAAVGSSVPTRLLFSSRSFADVIYRDELDRLVNSTTMLEEVH